MMTTINGPSTRLLKPMVELVPDRLVLGAGPGNMSPRVRAACSLPQLSASPTERPMVELMSDIRDGIRYALQTSTPYTMCISGSGNAGLEASCCNLLEPGEVFLLVETGYFAHKMNLIAQRYGIDIRSIAKPMGSVFSNEEIEQALVEHRPKVAYIVHGESTVGVLQDVQHLGPLCHKYDCLLIVDAVSSMGVVPLFMDKWGLLLSVALSYINMLDRVRNQELDVVFTGAQKVLGALVGITPVALSEAAWLKITSRKTPIKPLYFDFTLLASMWGCFGEGRYLHSPFNHCIYTIREALSELAEEGLENSWKKHGQCLEILHRGLVELGFTFVAENPSSRLPSVTAVRLPADFKDAKKFIQYLNERFNIIISPGFYPFEEAYKFVRIGVMGYNARPEVVDALLAALAKVIKMIRDESASSAD